ncbi:hypothetical protein F511_34733 [Dorcoceras hygrometricum]|uniref:Uncharacterized protein n=1 Tax=Dorcoceras hygrometricum TaxID=472368 RepID=A0A2Z7D569_9LAMI|nr:hypothetical protein F511_34733 [Dorcoceras hygrometricum]
MDQEDKQVTWGLLKKKSRAGKPDQGRENLIKDPSSWMLMMGKQKAAVAKRNQLGRKSAQRNDLLSVMNKPAQLQTKAGKNRTRASYEEQISSRAGEEESFERINKSAQIIETQNCQVRIKNEEQPAGRTRAEKPDLDRPA